MEKPPLHLGIQLGGADLELRAIARALGGQAACVVAIPVRLPLARSAGNSGHDAATISAPEESPPEQKGLGVVIVARGLGPVRGELRLDAGE